MEGTEASKGAGTDDGGIRLKVEDVRVSTILETVFLPLMTIVCLTAIAYHLYNIPWSSIWGGSSNAEDAAEFQQKLVMLLRAPFIFAWLFVWNGNPFSNLPCRYLVSFGSNRKLYCSDPSLLGSISAEEFLRARRTGNWSVYGSIYQTKTASGTLTVRAGLDNLVAWAELRFGTESLRSAVSQAEFRQQLQSAKRGRFLAWFRVFGSIFLFCDLIFVPSVLGLFAGLSRPFPLLDAAIFMLAFIYVAGLFLYRVPVRIVLMPDGLQVDFLCRSKSIPLDAVREIQPSHEGFKVIFAENGRLRTTRISQSVFNGSLVPLCLVLHESLGTKSAASMVTHSPIIPKCPSP